VARFEATLDVRGSGRVVVLPFDAKEAFGKIRAPVRVTVNGHTLRTTTMRYGGVDYIGFNSEVREAAGIAAGDVIEVTVEVDDDPRVVEVPPELAEALAGSAVAQAAFDGLSFTHRKEYARWIADAKRDETRERRVERAVEMLGNGVRTPDDAHES
jgi:bifunctional DNA-binding transcriptional regulator/antitoxin component of YhaV-PrlF toxin-antitoxin module